MAAKFAVLCGALFPLSSSAGLFDRLWTGGRTKDALQTQVLKLPVAWVQVPKTGSSLCNAIMSLACDRGWNASLGAGNGGHAFWELHPMEQGCASGFTGSKSEEAKVEAMRRTAGGTEPPLARWYASPPGHHGFGPFADTPLAAHGVTVLRQPEQRILSGYYYGLHSMRGYHGRRDPRNHIPPERDYFRAVRGCSVRMFTRDGLPCGPDPDGRGRTSKEEVRRAIQTIQRFQFVGIAERWAASICLWHLKFGGRQDWKAAGRGISGPVPPWWRGCSADQFVNTRPGRQSNASRLGAPQGYDVRVLAGRKDEADGALYHAAQRIFEWDLRRTGATLKRCRPCFEHAGVTVGLERF